MESTDLDEMTRRSANRSAKFPALLKNEKHRAVFIHVSRAGGHAVSPPHAPRAGDYVLQLNCLLERQLEWARSSKRGRASLIVPPFCAPSSSGRASKNRFRLCRDRSTSASAADWRGSEKSEQQQQLKAFLFRIENAALISIARLGAAHAHPLDEQSIIHLDPSSLLLDGWSLPLIFREVFEPTKHSSGRELKLDAPRPFASISCGCSTGHDAGGASGGK